jgi:hypothetical protein
MMAACRRLILAVALVLAAGSPVSTASAGLTIKDPVPSELQARVAGLLQDMRSGDADAAIGAARIIDGDLWRQYGLLFLRVEVDCRQELCMTIIARVNSNELVPELILNSDKFLHFVDASVDL